MKLLLINNGAALYRQGIYKLMDAEFGCDWVFGKPDDDIKQMDFSVLKGHVTLGRIRQLFNGKMYWQKGVVKQIFKDYSHYIVIGEERNLSVWIFLLFSLFTRKKKVYFWTHGAYGKEHGIKLFVSNTFARMTDGAFVYSNYARDILIKRGFSPERIFTIHNSLDYDKQIELRNSGLSSDVYARHFGNNNPVVIFIGRLTKVKKLDILIDAIARLREEGKHYNLVFVGNGSEHQALEEKMKSLGLNEVVWFYGACYDEKTNAELIYNADLCVAPGNVGLTAMHTMVFGTPVISHNNFPYQMPEFEAIHPDETGDFFEYDNVNSLAQVVQKWFDNHKDREATRQACYKEIDTQWNPQFQIEVLKKGLTSK